MGDQEYDISLKTSIGNLCVRACSSSEYPAISVCLRRNDGVEIDLAFIEVDETDRSANAYVYENTATEDWTKKFRWAENEVNILL
ncbi:hypothetical protein [Flavonifractor sp. An82]|uniref:hypothetical protein n=1 Tax=Flavonifractor sp. An82 TaxID=1965660 RepID=UPI0011240700|nr:hypothetical protein [Flavonifractor sp. An82]